MVIDLNETYRMMMMMMMKMKLIIMMRMMKIKLIKFGKPVADYGLSH